MTENKSKIFECNNCGLVHEIYPLNGVEYKGAYRIDNPQTEQDINCKVIKNYKCYNCGSRFSICWFLLTMITCVSDILCEMLYPCISF